MVAGGWDTPNYSHLDSVEILYLGSSSWVFTTPLPRAETYVRAANLDNTIYLFGGGTPSSAGLQSHSGGATQPRNQMQEMTNFNILQIFCSGTEAAVSG